MTIAPCVSSPATPLREANPPAPDAPSPDFVDVSRREGDVDWAAYAAAGKKMAACKLTEGGDWTDVKAARNRAEADKLGLKMGLYHYGGSSVAHHFNDPLQEANFYLGQVGTFGKNEFPILDFEETNGLKPAELVDWAGKWCAAVEEKTGKTPWIYTYSSFLHKLDAAPLTKYPLWFADYRTHDRDHPPSSAPWPHLAAWQFTWQATVPGVASKCDGSFLYQEP